MCAKWVASVSARGMRLKTVCSAIQGHMQDRRPQSLESGSPIVKAEPVDALESDGLAIGHNLPARCAECCPA